MHERANNFRPEIAHSLRNKTDADLSITTAWVPDYIMAGHAIVVVKDKTLLFYHGNAVILTL